MIEERYRLLIEDKWEDKDELIEALQGAEKNQEKIFRKRRKIQMERMERVEYKPESELSYLVRAGIYKSKNEGISEAVRVLLQTHPQYRIEIGEIVGFI